MRSIALALALAFAGSASAQQLQQRQLDAIGAIEITITSLGVEGEPERATGAIISPDGFVLTAAHIFSDEAYAICAAAPSVSPSDRCAISFFPKGNRARRVSAQLVPPRSSEHDFILLRLPQASDVIDRPEWPYLFVGEAPAAGAPLLAGGYAGEQELRQGGPNPLGLVPGIMSAAPSQACTQGGGWGVSNQMSGQTAPGYSGGPVFDARRRLVAIVLGRSCTTDLQGAPTTRVLTVASMPNVCTTARCRYGLPGYIAAYDGANARDWRQRLENGPAAADEFIYEWRLNALSQLTNWGLLCLTFNNPTNPQSAQRLRADFEAGGELATVYYYFVASACVGGAESNEANTLRTRVNELADAGFEPAQYLIAQVILQRLQQKLTLGAATLTYSFTEAERAEIARAERYLRQAGEAGWGAALFSHFDLCRARVATCTASRNELERAAELGVWDARRTLALYHLQGETNPAWTRRWNFSLNQDIPAALELLTANVQGSQPSAYPAMPILDNPSAMMLGYLYGGGRLRGREIVAPSLMQASIFTQLCFGGQPNAQIPIHAQCMLNDSVARFNLGSAQDRQFARAGLMYVKDLPTPIGFAAQNLLSWLDSGEPIRRLSCDFNDDLDLLPPAQQPTFEAGVAYCHYPTPR